MKLQLANLTQENLFTGYGEGYVVVNKQRYERSLVVMPERVIPDWPVGSFDQLDASHFEFLATLNPEILLLGTGKALRFPQSALTRCLTTKRIGLEVMDTSAACRTYNILMTEGRNVAAAVLIG